MFKITPSPLPLIARGSLVAAMALICSLKPVQADTVLFQDDFDAGTSAANWTTNKSIPDTTESEVSYAFDYKAELGIPSAPRSTGGTTIGTRFLVNKGTNATTTSGNQQGISASPNGQSFTGNFRIRFDLWINYVGGGTNGIGAGGVSIPGGSGTTQHTNFGWGTAGNSTQWGTLTRSPTTTTFGNSDSVMFSADGDGGTNLDYPAYRASQYSLSPAPTPPAPPVYAAGTLDNATATDARNSTNTYYNSFGNKTAPADQVAPGKFPQQTGTTPSGALGFAWRDVVIEKSGNIVTWTVDGKRLATVDITGTSLGGTNLFIGMWDFNAGASAGDDQLNAAIFDNVTVTSVTDVVESASSGALIREFRFRGPSGVADEFVEIFNSTGTPLNVNGWAIQTNLGTAAAPNIQTNFVPANTPAIPAYGHLLFTGTTYSLSAYGAGNASISSDASNDSGVALLNAAGAVQDAVGFTSSNASLREGAGLQSAPTANTQHSFARDYVVSMPKDSGDSTSDFVFLSTDGAGNTPTGGTAIPPTPGTNGAITARLGAPSPEGLTSPVYANNQITTTLLDGTNPAAAPNRVRVGVGNSGTLRFRRSITNTSGRVLTKVRLSVTYLSSLGTPVFSANQADLRQTSSDDENITLSDNSVVTVLGTRLEADADNTNGAAGPAQPLGGAQGSTLSFTAVLSQPLGIGEKRSYSFLYNVVRPGNFVVAINISALPNP